MGKTSNQRVSELLKTLKLSENEAASKIGKQANAIYRIVNNEVTPTKTTLKIIADSLGANYDWLLTGEGQMMNAAFKQANSNPWEVEAYQSVKAERDGLKMELERVWAMLNHLTGGKLPGFLKAAKGTGSLCYHLPGAAFGESLTAQGIN